MNAVLAMHIAMPEIIFLLIIRLFFNGFKFGDLFNRNQ